MAAYNGPTSITVPVGTTTERDTIITTPAAGMFRFNSTDVGFEGYNGTEWGPLGGASGLGSSEYVAERLGHYICSAGLIDSDGNPKPAWNEFGREVQMSSNS